MDEVHRTVRVRSAVEHVSNMYHTKHEQALPREDDLVECSLFFYRRPCM